MDVIRKLRVIMLAALIMAAMMPAGAIKAYAADTSGKDAGAVSEISGTIEMGDSDALQNKAGSKDDDTADASIEGKTEAAAAGESAGTDGSDNDGLEEEGSGDEGDGDEGSGEDLGDEGDENEDPDENLDGEGDGDEDPDENLDDEGDGDEEFDDEDYDDEEFDDEDYDDEEFDDEDYDDEEFDDEEFDDEEFDDEEFDDEDYGEDEAVYDSEATGYASGAAGAPPMMEKDAAVKSSSAGTSGPAVTYTSAYKNSNVPKTGDNSELFLNFAAMIAAAAGSFWLIRRRIRHLNDR